MRSLIPDSIRGALLAATVFVASAAHGDVLRDDSLYTRMGGGEVIQSIANELIDQASSDPRTGRTWHKVTLSRVKQFLGEYLCSITGGPCTYTGDTMQQIHAGMNIDEAEMFAVVEQLREILVLHGIPLRERNELLALLAPSKRDVVTR